MKVLFLTSEAYPLIKTGGLADVSGALPAALQELGEDVRIMLPAYPQVLDKVKNKKRRIRLGNPLGIGETALIPAAMPDSGVYVWCVDCPAIYDRQGGPYVDAHGEGWRDNHLRFALLSRVAALTCIAGDMIGWRPDILHANDWQTGLTPAYLSRWDGVITPTVFNIHNLQYQGNFDPYTLGAVALPPDMFSMSGVEFYGRVSFMKAAVQFSRRIIAVSPTYAREIQTPEKGMGLQGLLSSRGNDLRGILNGVDYGIWDPATDKQIVQNYSPDTLDDKAANKKALQEEVGLEVDAHAPLFGVVSRLSSEKGLDLVLDALHTILEVGGQLLVLGSGDSFLERAFAAAAAGKKGRFAARIGYDEALAHRIQAGSDVLMVPSRVEPCGLTQLYALRYGTLPLVRHTGGLADTVIDATDWDLGTGFVFDHPSAAALGDTIRRAADLYSRQQDWRIVQKRAMAQEFSWARSAREYAALYREVV